MDGLKITSLMFMVLWISGCGQVIKQLDTNFGGPTKTVYPQAQPLPPLVIPPELALTAQ